MPTKKTTTTKTKPKAAKKAQATPPSKTTKTSKTAKRTARVAARSEKAAATPRRVTKETLAITTPQKKSRRLRKPQVVSGFTEFLREQSVVGLAIGLVIGAQVKALADQLIASFINPLIGLVLPGTGALDKKVFVVELGDKSARFAWGSFAAVMLSFITTALVIYFVFKALKLDKLAKKKT